MFILLFMGGSLYYEKELLIIFTKPLQATVMLSLYFAETMSLCDYASVPWGFNNYAEPEPIPLFFILILLFVGGSLDYHWKKLITKYMYF